MPAKTGASHGIAAFVTLLLGTIMSKFVWNAVPPLGELSLLTIETIRSLTGLDIPANDQFAGAVVVMVLLSFAWGVVYHFGRHA